MKTNIKYLINLAMIPISVVLFLYLMVINQSNLIAFSVSFFFLLTSMFYFLFESSNISSLEWEKKIKKEAGYKCEICKKYIGENGKFSRSGSYLCEKDWKEVINSNLFVNWL